MVKVQGWGFRFNEGLGSRVSGFGFRVQGSGAKSLETVKKNEPAVHRSEFSIEVSGVGLMVHC